MHCALSSPQHSLCLLLVCCTFALGCGASRPETAPVTGKVVFRGKALHSGRITFYPAEGRPAIGTLTPEGTYTLTTFSNGDGALLGKHRVTIEVTKVVDVPAPKSLKDENAHLAALSRKVVEWSVPEKFARQDTSPLTADVVRGGNTINFALP